MLAGRPLAAFSWLAALLAGGACCTSGDGDEKRLGLLGGRGARVFYSAAILERVAALTIDDAPDQSTTPEILAVLEKHGARATFFVIADQIPGNER